MELPNINTQRNFQLQMLNPTAMSPVGKSLTLQHSPSSPTLKGNNSNQLMLSPVVRGARDDL